MALTFKSVFGQIKAAVGKVLGGGAPQLGALGPTDTNGLPSLGGGLTGNVGGNNTMKGLGVLGGLPFSLPNSIMPSAVAEPGSKSGNPALGALGQIAATATAIQNIWGGGDQYAPAAVAQATAIAKENLPGVVATPDGIAFTGSGNKGLTGSLGGGFTLGGSFGAGNRGGLLDGLTDTQKLIGAGVLGWLLMGRRRGL